MSYNKSPILIAYNQEGEKIVYTEKNSKWPRWGNFINGLEFNCLKNSFTNSKRPLKNPMKSFVGFLKNGTRKKIQKKKKAGNFMKDKWENDGRKEFTEDQRKNGELCYNWSPSLLTEGNF